MKPLIENGHIYIATPPLYLVRRGNQHEYAWNEEQRKLYVQQFSEKRE